MNYFRHILTSFALLASAPLIFAESVDPARQRTIILADMGNEPDEEQQMIHMLMCSNEFDIEGLLAVTGKYLREKTRPDLFTKLIDSYEKVYPNLQKHAKGWHDPKALRLLVKSGLTAYGIDAVKEGQANEGADLILAAATKDDPRPLWIVLNAGSNTLAQALVNYRATHSRTELDALVAKLRIFENGAQDNAGAWICSEFPNISWIRSNFQTYAYGGPGESDGESGYLLGPHFWQPHAYTPDGQHEWLKEHVMTKHGALGDIYPERRFHFEYGKNKLGFMEGGGTIPWMGLVNKGLFDVNQPSWGGWGGRFSAKKVPCFWSRHADNRVDEEKIAPFYTHREVSDSWVNPLDNKTYNGDHVPVWRWRPAMFNDFKCRMDWCVEPFEKANHHPIAAINGDKNDTIIRMNAIVGDVIQLDASESNDPDKDQLTFQWWQYLEAGTFPGNVTLTTPTESKTSFKIPSAAADTQLHVILEIKDNNAIGALHDYRRVVIDVSPHYPHHKLFKQKY